MDECDDEGFLSETEDRSINYFHINRNLEGEEEYLKEDEENLEEGQEEENLEENEEEEENLEEDQEEEEENQMELDFPKEVNYDEIFNSVYNLNDDEIEQTIDENERIVFGKNERPFILDPPPFYHKAHRSIPKNTQFGELNYANLPDNLPSISEVFKLFITEDIVNLIAKYTNLNALNMNHEFTTDSNEIYNFIGFLIYQAFQKDNDVPLNQLFHKFNRRSFYRATTSRNRLTKLLHNLRFDDKNLRTPLNRFKPFEEIFKLFKKNLPKYWRPSKNITIDEMISPFKGKCPFKVYQPAKPNKYGILARSVCDSQNAYLLNLEIYKGEYHLIENEILIF